jgi:RNA polymerase sigma-54 factor
MLAQSQNLRVSLEQGLRMNQQMLHSIKLMELPVTELRERIEAELAVNPALDIVEKAEKEVKEARAETVEEGDFFETAIAAAPYDFRSSRKNRAASSGEDDEKRRFLEGAPSQPESLQEHLLWQLRLQKLDEHTRRIGELLIGNLDEDGFHLVSPAELLPGEDPAKIEAALSVIRYLDPQGCAAADYRESLAIQGALRFDDGPSRTTGDAIKALLPYLSELEKGKFAAITKQTGIKTERIAWLFERIKELSPFPGRQFSGGANTGTGVRLVVPDIEVHRKDGELMITLNDEEIPVLRVRPFFTALRKCKPEDKSTRDFVNEYVAGAKWFINAVYRRNHTLLRVTHVITERQQAFFEKGPAYIAPLTRHEVAAELGLDDSTISRTTSSKYMQTDWGIYELRYFFSNAIAGHGSERSPYSKAGVKEIIKEIIAHAEKRTSDNEIAHLLEEQGIKIARRTVAKYRNELENI